MSKSRERPRRRRPSLDFYEMGVRKESRLTSIETGDTATVKSHRTVVFRGEEMYLTKATRMAMEKSYDVAAPTHHWKYNGKRLGDIYDETYGRPK